MKRILLFLCLALAAPAFAGPWVDVDPLELSVGSTSQTVDLGEKFGKIDNLRFQVQGQTVEFKSITAIPVKGDPIVLRNPGFLKSGESSGLLNIPGQATVLLSLKFEYAITTDNSAPAKLTLRLKTD